MYAGKVERMMLKLIGAAILAIPFLLIVAASVVKDGWCMTLMMLAVVGIMVGCVYGGVYLLKL